MRWRSQEQTDQQILEGKRSNQFQFGKSRDSSEMGNANNNGQAAAKVSTNLIEGSNICQTWQEQTSQFARPSEQYAELANTRRELWDEGNSRKLDTQEEIGTASAIHNQPSCEGQNVSNTTSLRQSGQGQHEQPISSKTSGNWQANIIEPIGTPAFWTTEPNVGRVVDGLASRMDRLKAIGNGQVPLCAATAWRILSEP
jgi:hypothetical protein